MFTVASVCTTGETGEINNQHKLPSKNQIRGQSYKDFYTLRQIYKHVLKHENNTLAQTFAGHNFRTQYPNKFVGLHFSILLKRQFRHFILHRPKV